MRFPPLPPSAPAAGCRRGIDARRSLAAALALVLAAGLPARAAESAADFATRSLLLKLEERRMPDVALWVLDRVAKDPAASAELKAEVPLRRATALVGVSRVEGDPKKRAELFDEAKKEIDQFLAASPEGSQAIAAYSQKGNLLVQQAGIRLERAKRPGADVAALRKEAIGLFDEAIKSLEGKAKPGEEIKKVDNAEDAVVKELRAVNDKIAALKPKEPAKEGDEKKPKKPVKRDPAAAKQLEPLEDLKESLQTQLVQTRLLTASAYFEKAKAYDENSKEWKAALEESTKQFKELADKYPTLGGGLYARYYTGRNLALLGERGKAVDALSMLLVLEDKDPLAIRLRAKSLATALECWLAEKKFDAFDPKMRAFANANIPAARLDADWLALKYRTAALLKEQAAGMPREEAAKAKPLVGEAVKLAKEVANANREFTDEARELLRELGKEGGVAAAEQTFDSVMEDARLALTTMQQRQAEAKQEADATKQQEILAKAAEERTKAIAGVVRALKLSGDADLAAVNQARYMLTALMFDGQRFHDAAALGTFLAERYPNAPGSRKAARVAMASWQQLQKQPDAAGRKEAQAKCSDVADLIIKTWPAESEAADAAVIAIASATERRDAARILAVAAAIPAESPRRGEVLARAGTALWREVMEQGRLEESLRAPAETVAGWKKTAREYLDVGLAAPPGVGLAFRTTVAAALSRCQIALDEGDAKAAVTILENPTYGPWTVINDATSDPALREGSFAEAALTVALRSFIQAEQIDKAQQAMEQLEKLAGAGESEEKSARLTAMYLSMGRELQEQLERLGAAAGTDAAAGQKAASILAGFERFLDGVAKRDPKVSSQIWVATTYLTLGSGKGTGAVVPKAKAEAYLDKAASVYDNLFAKKGDADVARFEPSIRLKMASVYRERGKWDEAQEQLDWILSDAKRQNSLETQVQAAETLQAAARALVASDAAAAEAKFREASAGRPKGPAVMWGWNGIANKVLRQAFSGNDEKALKSREVYFNARLNQAMCLLARAQLPGKAPDQAKELASKAEQAITMTRKLNPDLGGKAMQAQFEKVLKDVQKQLGNANPRGFAELDEKAAAAAAAAQAVPATK